MNRAECTKVDPFLHPRKIRYILSAFSIARANFLRFQNAYWARPIGTICKIEPRPSYFFEHLYKIIIFP